MLLVDVHYTVMALPLCSCWLCPFQMACCNIVWLVHHAFSISLNVQLLPSNFPSIVTQGFIPRYQAFVDDVEAGVEASGSMEWNVEWRWGHNDQELITVFYRVSHVMLETLGWHANVHWLRWFSLSWAIIAIGFPLDAYVFDTSVITMVLWLIVIKDTSLKSLI